MCFLGFEKIPVKSKKAQDKFKNPASSRPGSVPVKKVPSGDVPVRGGSQQPPVRRVAPVSSGGVGVRPVQQVRRVAPVVPGRVPVGRRPQQSPVRGVAPVSSGGVGVRPVQQVRRVAPVVPGRVPVGRRPQQPVRGVAPVSPGVGVRPVQQARRAVPVRRVPVTSSLSPPVGQTVQDNGLGTIPPVKNVSGSKFGFFKNFFGAVRGRFEDVLDNFEGIGDVFDSFKERFEGVQGVMGFLLVHWWAILVVLGVIGILAFSGFVGVSSLKQECTFSLSVDCLDHSVKENSIELLIKNVAERNIIVKNIKVRSDTLEGSSGSGSGICELALDQRGRDLKKNQKYLFQLNVRPAVSLSAAAPNDDNVFDLLAESVTLARAQRLDSYDTPDLRATPASVSCAANGSASDYLGRFGRNDPLRASLDHYMGIVTDAVAKDPTPDSSRPASRASTRGNDRANEIIDVVVDAVYDINAEASKSIGAGSSNNYQNVRNAVINAPDNFDSDSVQHKYAVMVKERSKSQQTSDKLVQFSRSAADEIIAEVTTNLNEITAAARDESDRAFNPDSVKRSVRAKAESYAGQDSYFAADFVANAAERAGTVGEIRSNANAAHASLHSPNLQNPRKSGGNLYNYVKIIFGYKKVTHHPFYGGADEYGRRTSTSYSDYFKSFNRTDFRDGAHKSMGPVVDHYHVLIRDRLIPAYTRELEDLENSAFYKGLSSSEKAALSSAFNDPYYDGQPEDHYGLPITSPLDDPGLNSRHLEANDLIKTELYDRFYSAADSLAWSGIGAAREVRDEANRQVNNPSNADSVKDAAKKQVQNLQYVRSGTAAKFVSESIGSITSSNRNVVASEIEAAVSDAIAAVTEGASYVADQARDANSGHSSGQLESQIKSYIRSEYPSSHAGHHAALFIANSDISGTDTASIVEKIRSAGDKISNAVQLGLGNVSEDALDRIESACSSSCSRYCYDANCLFEEYVLEFPERCEGPCTDVGGSCSDDVECCSGSCERGACLDPNAAADSCGSEGQVCCVGNSCDGNLVCSSGSCQAAVVCGSEGQVCCTSGAACVSGLLCGTSDRCEAPVVCGSEGQCLLY